MWTGWPSAILSVSAARAARKRPKATVAAAGWGEPPSAAASAAETSASAASAAMAASVAGSVSAPLGEDAMSFILSGSSTQLSLQVASFQHGADAYGKLVAARFQPRAAAILGHAIDQDLDLIVYQGIQPDHIAALELQQLLNSDDRRAQASD